MGTICATNYANIFLGMFEINFIYHVFKHFQIFIVDLLLRYFYPGMEVKYNFWISSQGYILDTPQLNLILKF